MKNKLLFLIIALLLISAVGVAAFMHFAHKLTTNVTEEEVEFTDRPSGEKEYSIGDKVDGGVVADFDAYNQPFIKYSLEVNPEEIKSEIEQFISLYNIEYNFSKYEVVDSKETDIGFYYTLKLPGFTPILKCEKLYSDWCFEWENPDTTKVGYGVYYGSFDINEDELHNIDIPGILVIDNVTDTSIDGHASFDSAETYHFDREDLK